MEGQRGWAGCWGGIRETRRSSRVGREGGKSSYRAWCFPNTLACGVCVCVCGGGDPPAGKPPPAQFHPDAKAFLGQTQGRGQEAGGDLITALNRSKLLLLVSKSLHGEGWAALMAKESPVVMLILTSVLTVHKIRTELPFVKVSSSKSLQRAEYGPSYLHHL